MRVAGNSQHNRRWDFAECSAKGDNNANISVGDLKMRSEPSEITIVIPNYNGAHLLRDLLPQLLDLPEVRTRLSEIIVVDDASTDGSLQVLDKFSASIRVIKQTRNSGFIVTANNGVHIARSRYVFLMNTDVVLFGDTLNVLYDFIAADKTNSVFAVSPTIYSEQGSIVSPHLVYPSWRDGFFRLGKCDDVSRVTRPSRTFVVSGGSGLFDIAKFYELGGFRQIFRPMYSEDVDLCWRSWNYGWQCYYHPLGKVVHTGRGVTKSLYQARCINQLKIRNRILMMWCNASTHDLIRYHLARFVFMFKNQYDRLQVAKAVVESVASFPEVLKCRSSQAQKRNTEDITNQIVSDW
jgi:GT2 family glycosyltransferase